jgi:hypothetical protein
MTLVKSKESKFLELFKTVEILFNNNKFGLMYSEIDEAWLFGVALRDLLLLKNPQINNYDFYFKVENERTIYPWLSRLAEEDIDFNILENNYHINNNQVFQIIVLSLMKFGIDAEITIYIGKINPQDFIFENMPITLTLVGLDMANLLVLLGNNESINRIFKKIWFSKEYKRDIKNKNINILKQKWMLNKDSYTYLEDYLEKTHRDYSGLGFK